MKQKRNDKTEARNEMEIVKDETETSARAARDCASRAIHGVREIVKDSASLSKYRFCVQVSHQYSFKRT